MRVVSWNIENLAPWLPDGKLAGQWRALGEPDVLCLQEVRIRAGDTSAIAQMQQTLPGFTCHFSLNRDKQNGTFRGGRAYGVVTYARSDLHTRQIVIEWDLEGRICTIALPERSLILVNVYAVNGTARPHFDHERGARHDDRHAFKQAFIERLTGMLDQAPFAGTEQLLIGDWNTSRARIDATPRLRTEEPHATARRRFNEEFLPALDLVDVFRERNPQTRAYTWFNPRARGRLDAARVDFALVSRSLLPDVLDAGIEQSPECRPGSDHAPLWLTLR